MRLTRAVAHEGQGEEPVLPWTLDENRDLGATRLGFTPGAARARKLIFGLRRFTGRLSEAPDPPPALRGSSPRPTKYTTRAWSKTAEMASLYPLLLFKILYAASHASVRPTADEASVSARVGDVSDSDDENSTSTAATSDRSAEAPEDASAPGSTRTADATPSRSVPMRNRRIVMCARDARFIGR